MAETTLLRQNAIVRNASVGSTPPHGPVKTGELPLVQVKQPPGGPQVQEGQQRPVTILPPKDSDSAVRTGGLPMVHVKMTQNGPQADDGRDNPVLVKNNRQTVAAGNLPMVQVKMENGRPQVQTSPNVAAGPPHLPSAAPALSAPRVQQLQTGARVTRVAAPRPALAAPQVALPPVPDLSTEQLMLCRHLVEQYLTELRSADGEESDSVKFAAAAAATLDDILVATAVHAEAAAIVAATPVAAPASVANTYVAPRPVTGGHFSPASLSPTPPRATGYVAQGYVAQVPGTRSHVASVRSQGHASMAPRRVQRAPGAAPLPPVIVQMNGNQPMVQPPPAEQPIAAPAEQPIAAPAEQPIVDAPATNSDAQG